VVLSWSIGEGNSLTQHCELPSEECGFTFFILQRDFLSNAENIDMCWLRSASLRNRPSEREIAFGMGWGELIMAIPLVMLLRKVAASDLKTPRTV
jgi:hypothetical protein